MHVRIRQLDEKVATAGLHFGLGPKARKLEPGEVVDIPEGDLFNEMWETGKLELTRDPVTRPLVYESEREAKLCSPTFKPRGATEERDQQRALDNVSERLATLEVASEPEPVTESPATSEPRESVPPELPPELPAGANKRAARRRAALREQETIT